MNTLPKPACYFGPEHGLPAADQPYHDALLKWCRDSNGWAMRTKVRPGGMGTHPVKCAVVHMLADLPKPGGKSFDRVPLLAGSGDTWREVYAQVAAAIEAGELE